MKTLLWLLTLCLVSTVSGETLMAQDNYRIELKSRTFVPPSGTDPLFRAIEEQGIIQKGTLSGKIHALLQFYEIPTEFEQRALENAGIVLHDYLPSRAYSASIEPRLRPEELAELGVRYAALFEPTDKIDPALLEGHAATRSKDPEKSAVYILAYPDVPVDRAKAMLIIEHNCEVISASDNFKTISAIVSNTSLLEVANSEWVAWIEAMPEFEPRNDGSRALVNVDSVQASPYLLTGNGLKLGMWDEGRVFAHDGFSGRLTIKNNVAVNAHATHVAGTMAGNGANSTNRYLRGMDTLAQIYSWSFRTAGGQGKTWDSIATEMRNGFDQDAIVLSQNSWGDPDPGSNTGIYTVGARLMDQVVRQKDRSVIFAVGYGGHGYNSMWSPETGKNLIAVTATTKTGDAYTPASSGPCRDGRLKPDISAAGVNIRSTWTNNSYEYMSGTSMACPAISGVVGLLIERYKSRNNGAVPSASMIKAILLNTARDIGTAGPDYLYGYGLANALAAVRTIDAGSHLASSISQGGTNNHNLTVPSGLGRLRVMLSYTDREAAVNADPALVNNLDLKLIAPNGTQNLPLTLDPANPSAPAQPGVNNRDNVEQVVVSNPMSGNWTVRVTAPTVPFGPQAYVITWDIPGITVTVDQKLADGQTSVDSVGRWEGGPNFATYRAPKQFTFTPNSLEALRGAQKIISNQKYNKWSIDDTVLNHRRFTIQEGFPDELVSQFAPTDPSITIKTDLIDLPGTTGGNIQFRDPWYIDSLDGAHGNNPMNRGMQSAVFRTRESTPPYGFRPNFDTPFPPHNQPYRGVFLNQGEPNFTRPPYYSVGAPRVNTFTIGA